MEAAIQILMGAISAICFSILFNVRGRKLVAAGAGAALSWWVYLLSFGAYEDKVVSLFLATLVVGILSEILARLIKTPVIITLVPMLVPLFPGGDLFYATSNLVQNNTEQATRYLDLVMKEAGAIAFAIILVTCVVQVILKVFHHFAKDRNIGL